MPKVPRSTCAQSSRSRSAKNSDGPLCPPGATCTATTSSGPLLGALQFNGGDTPTLMIGPASAALNVGVGCAAVDQRGVARPQGVACDLGAVERKSVEETIFNDGFGD